jgi:septal ring factor EnvC (AmiA/AmiB activator)
MSMDANELASIAIDAMPLEVLVPIDRGQVWGVLQMALRTLEAQHEALLAEADEETRQAMAVIADMTQQEAKLQAELMRLHKEVKTVTNERDGWQAETVELQRRIDSLNAENARLHRSMEQWMSAAQHAQALPPGAVKVPPGTEEL